MRITHFLETQKGSVICQPALCRENQAESLLPAYRCDGVVEMIGRGWLSPCCSVYSPCSSTFASHLLCPLPPHLPPLPQRPPFHSIPQRIRPNSKAAVVGNRCPLPSSVELIHKEAGMVLGAILPLPSPLLLFFSHMLPSWGEQQSQVALDCIRNVLCPGKPLRLWQRARTLGAP